jgi:hypothetical protein
VRAFAEERLAAIDKGERLAQPWRIFALGRFPELDWSIAFLREQTSYYEISTKSPLPGSCRSRSGGLLATDDWLKKIRSRYASNYHPLLNLKSWVRLPIGIAYGVGTFAAGAGILVGGCAIDPNGNTGGIGCHYAARAGVALMSESFNVADYALKPDMRHWRRMPAAVLVTRASTPSAEECVSKIDPGFRLAAIDLSAPDTRRP